MVCKLLSMSLNLMLKVSLLLTMFAEVTSSHCGLQCFFLFVLIFLVFMILAEDGRGRASGRRDGAGGRVEEKGWPDPEAWWKAWKSPVQGSRGKYPAS